MYKILALLLCFLLAPMAVAKAESPKVVLQVNIDQVMLILKNPDYKVAEKRAPLRDSIEKIIRNTFDFDEFSARTVGADWQKFTPEQKKQFYNSFANLLLLSYLDKVEGYNGEQITYNTETLSSKKDRAEVQTTVTLSDGKVIPVAYRLLLKNDHWVVYDVLIENISLIKNYRSQFQDVLAKGNPAELIARVEASAASLRQ